MGEREMSVPSGLTAPRVAREFLRETLSTQNLDGFGEVSELLTTELVANVVSHVGSPVTMWVYTRAGWLRVEVDDSSTDAPVLRPPDPSTPSGNGLRLIDGLATRWGTEVRPAGKTVWFELDVPTATEEVHGGHI